MEATYRVPAHAIPAIEKAIAKLNKRAAKVNVPEIVLTDTGERETVEVKRGVNMFGETVVQEQVWASITVTGVEMKLADWSFVATVEHTEAGNIIRRIAADEREFDLARFRESGKTCDHCKLARRRNDTYIVAHADGRLAQVGSNCLADFTGSFGSRDPQAVVKLFEGIYNLFATMDAGEGDFESYGGSRGENAASIESFLSVTQAAVHAHGWTSRGNAYNYGGFATADRVWEALFARDTKDYKPWRPTKDEYEVGKTEAVPMIEWARNIDEDTDNDYLYNLRVAALNDYVTSRRAGILASLYVAYNKAMERELEIKRQAAKTNEHIGADAKGKLIPTEVTVTKARECETQFGPSFLYLFEDADGRQIKWFSSSDKDFKVGDSFKLTGKVKKLDDYNGRKQTVITHGKVV